MNLAAKGALFAVGLFVGILVCLELGRRIGRRRIAADPEGGRAGLGAVDGAVFGLLGLLIAFTFSGATTRFDDRRHLVAEEANAIGTAWLRIDLAAEDAQPKLRELFRRYLDSRLDTYRKARNVEVAMDELARSTKIQEEIWTAAVAGCRDSTLPSACMLLLPSLNQMIDITTTRLMATRIHPPVVIFWMLGALALVGALLAGHEMAEGRGRNWTHEVAFAAVVAAIVYIIIDIEYPRLGLIRVDAADEVLVDLRQGMK